MNLAAMTPQNELASTQYCLASQGEEFLVYLPDGGNVTVDLSAAIGVLSVEWFNPITGRTIEAEPTIGGEQREFTTPFAGDAVLYIHMTKK
jgi:hypothetical protein